MTTEPEIRVLIVEDEPVTAEAHAEYVRRLDGFTVGGVAHTGAEAILALRAARKGDPVDVILLDIHLPDMTGIDLCRSMRAAGLEVDVIAVTAARDAAVVRSAVSLGIVQYLIKPFTFAAFADKLRAYQAYRVSVLAEHVTDQRALDAAFALLRAEPATNLPKGLTPATLDLVRKILREHTGSDGISATELAARAALSRPTARRYLEHLTAVGLVSRVQRYGAPGRPEIEYRLTER
jgi:response regulator of citrate/malate metabolism